MDQNVKMFRNKPELVSNAKILEKIKCENVSEINNNKYVHKIVSETPTPSTDMMVNYLANSSKMISDDRQWMYNKNNKNTENNNEEYEEYLNNNEEISERLNNNMKSDDPKLIFTGIDNQNTKTLNRDSQTINDDVMHAPNYYSAESKKTNNENIKKQCNENTCKTEKSYDDIKIKMTNQKMQKLEMLRKLGSLVKSGVKLSGTYNMESDLEVMTYEYELHRSLRAKENATKFWCGVLINGITGLEMMNDRYNPFDLHISGLSEQIKSEKENYLEVIGEIYEKYNTPGKAYPPEIKLVFMIFFSALQFHLAQAAAKQIPALDGILKNAPGLLNILRQQSCANKQETEVDKIHKKVNDLEYLKKKEMENLRKEYTNMENESKSQKETEKKNNKSELRGPILNNELLRKLMNPQQNINRSQLHTKDTHINDIRGIINPQDLNKNFVNNMHNINHNSDSDSDSTDTKSTKSSKSSKSTKSSKSSNTSKSSEKIEDIDVDRPTLFYKKKITNENNSNESVISFGKKRSKPKTISANN